MKVTGNQIWIRNASDPAVLHSKLYIFPRPSNDLRQQFAIVVGNQKQKQDAVLLVVWAPGTKARCRHSTSYAIICSLSLASIAPWGGIPEAVSARGADVRPSLLSFALSQGNCGIEAVLVWRTPTRHGNSRTTSGNAQQRMQCRHDQVYWRS
jgi:hypothetical protein